MRSHIKLGHLFGIEIGAHYSWLIIALLVTLSLVSYFHVERPAWSPPVGFAAAIVATTLFFISLVVHELAHSLVARAYGIRVRAITLFIFGGVAQIEEEPKSPGSECLIALAGPFASLAIAGWFWLIGLIFSTVGLITATVSWLATVNLAIALFNLTPAFPLDGGRLLHGLLWKLTGNARSASLTAIGAGKLLAWLMIILGGISFMRSGFNINGLWLALIGWFLLNTAQAGESDLIAEELLSGITGSELISRNDVVVDAQMPISSFIKDHLLRSGQQTYLVMRDGLPAGIISGSDITRLNRNERERATVAELTTPLDRLLSVSADMSAQQILSKLAKENAREIAVLDHGRLVGIITLESIIKLLKNRAELLLANNSETHTSAQDLSQSHGGKEIHQS